MSRRIPALAAPPYPLPLRWYLCVFLCISLAFLYWQLGLQANHHLPEAELVTFYLDSDYPTASSYQTMQENEARAGTNVPFTLWTQKDRQVVTDKVTRRSASASLLFTRGNSRLVLPVSPTLALTDYTGCLIDEDTALELFGSRDATGSLLQYDGKEYVVRGCFPAPSGTVVFALPPNSTLPLNLVTVYNNDDSSAFPMRHGLDAGWSFSTNAYQTAVAAANALPVIVVILLFLEALFLLMRANRQYSFRYTLFTLLFLCVLTATVITAFSAMPAGWIPSRWSDFTFWSQLYKKWKTAIIHYASVPKSRLDLLLISHTLSSLWAVLAASLLFPVRQLFHHAAGGNYWVRTGINGISKL